MIELQQEPRAAGPDLDRASGFFGCVTPTDDAESAHASRQAFLQAYGTGPEVALQTPSFAVHLGLGPGATAGSDPTGRVTVVLNGELFLEGCPDAAAVAQRYLEMGEDFARDLNGSFALLLVDRVFDRVLLVTDRAGTVRLFHGVKGGHHWVGSDVSLLPTDRFQIDPVGIGWYLANGSTHNGRTPYDGIRALRRSTIFRATRSGLASSEYWDLRFPAPGTPVDEDALAEELVRRLERAVRRHVADDPQVFLSLSGGWDSASLAGLLADRVGLTGVRCFSYVYGDAQPGSDPAVARSLANTLGYEHQLIQSYGGDLAVHVRLNGRRSQGTAPVADEAEAWETLRPQVEALENPVLFVGDHYLGDNPIRTGHHGETPPGKMRQFDRLAWLAPHLPRKLFRLFRDGIAADVDEVRAHAGPEATGGYFFFDARLASTVVAWRRSHPGRFMTVRWPLLDYELLDWTCMVPPDIRKKCLYQHTAERVFPRAFQVPRASSAGYYPPLRDHIREQAGALRSLAREGASRLEEVVPAGLGDAMVTLASPSDSLGNRIRYRLERNATRAQVMLRKKLGRSPKGRMVTPQRALRHYLVLRQSLRSGEAKP